LERGIELKVIFGTFNLKVNITVFKSKKYKIKSIMYLLMVMLLPRKLREGLMMWKRLGYIPQIKHPRSFNENIVHRKLFHHDARYAVIADKWLVREYVRERVGNEFLSKDFGFIKKESDLKWDKLPDRFVAKPTHCSGLVAFVKEKSEQQKHLMKQRVREWLGRKYGGNKDEYWYLEMEPKIIFEEWLDGPGVPLDYKFFVFHGKVKIVQVDFDRHVSHARNFFEPNWTELNFSFKYPRKPTSNLKAPKQLRKMIELAETLGAGFDFVRVDLYHLSDGRIVFGEMTLAPESGRGRFSDREVDFALGRFWNRKNDVDFSRWRLQEGE